MILLPTEPDDVGNFLEELLSPELLRLETYFAANRATIAEYIKVVHRALPPHEREQVSRLLNHWAQLNEETPVRHFWDFRPGRERNSIPTSTDLMPREVRAAVAQIDEAWALDADHPISGTVETTVVLGGLIPTSLSRVRFLAKLLLNGGLQSKQIIGLAGHRRLSEEELHHIRRSSSSIATEGDALFSALEAVMDSRGFAVALAPDLDGSRATTGSALDWLLSTQIRRPASVAIVTSSLYRIQSHIDLLCHIPGDAYSQTASVGLVGTGQRLKSQHYLQEIKAALDAANRLTRWAEDRSHVRSVDAAR